MKPRELKIGDKVGFAAPARRISATELEPSVKLFRQWGLEVVLPEGLYEAEGQMGGSDRHRADLMQRLLDDEEIAAIICCRGGYGTVKIIDRLDFSHFAERPKWIVGYSDITVLHSHIAQHYGIATAHATMPIDIPDEERLENNPSTESLHRLLFGDKISYRFQNQSTIANKTGKSRGRLIGGNLSILYSLIGSASDITTDGCILFLEDVDEYLYHIDRMMTALRRAGKLENLKGIIVGAFTKMHDNTVPFGHTVEEIIAEATSGYTYPIAFGMPAGHIQNENQALPLGTDCSISVDRNNCLIEF